MYDKTRLSKCGWWKTKDVVNQMPKRKPDTGIGFRWNVQNYWDELDSLHDVEEKHSLEKVSPNRYCCILRNEMW
jgi:hypothetical protein